MSATVAVISTLQNLWEQQSKKQEMIQKRREQLEGAARSNSEKKFNYYASEKTRARDKCETAIKKYEDDLEKYRISIEKKINEEKEKLENYLKYCDDGMTVKIDEDSDKVITGHKFDLKAINEKVEATEILFKEAQERDSKKLKEMREIEQRQLDAIKRREMNMIYGSRERAPTVIPVVSMKTQEEIEAEEAEEKAKKAAYVAQFENFNTTPMKDPIKQQKLNEAIEAKKKFNEEIRPALTSEELEVFDDKDYMEQTDRRRIHLMTLEEAKKAIEFLADDVKKLRSFRNESMNLPSEKDWDDFDMLKKSYQIEVIEKSNRNDRVKTIKRLLKRRD